MVDIYIFLYICLFFIGLGGFLLADVNVIKFLISLELLSLSASMIFILSSFQFLDLFGFLVSLFNLTLAGAESAIGLVLLINVYAERDFVQLSSLTLLKS